MPEKRIIECMEMLRRMERNIIYRCGFNKIDFIDFRIISEFGREQIMNILEIVMSSAVVAALIGWIRGNKENQLTYITGERSVWRREMKECIEGLQTCRLRDIDKWLIKLKVNLNGYGCYNPGQYPENLYLDFLRDEHIWKVIDEIERECKKSNSLKKRIKHQKEKLVRLLVILLKFEWEKSKKEVKADKMLFISVASWLVYVLIVCYFVFHFLSEKGMETLAIVSFMAVIIGSVTIFYLLSWSANIVDRIKTLRGKKWYRKIKIPIFSWTFGLFCEIMIIEALATVIESNAIFFISIFFFGSFLIPMYKLSKDHQFYTEYDQSVIRVLELNTLLFYDRVPDKESTKVLEKLMDEGVNCRIEDDIEVFIKDEYFRKFIENEPIESILFPRGVKKYKRLYHSLLSKCLLRMNHV